MRVITFLLLMSGSAFAQVHHHPGESEAVDQFYSTWMMPDQPTRSCCNKVDCAPAQAKFSNGRWFAKRDGDADWRIIPPAKIEQNRDSPDGRNHLCAPLGDNATVYCFITGSGG